MFITPIIHNGKNPNVHQLVNRFKNIVYPYMGHYSAIYKKEWSTGTCNNMNELWKYYAMRTKLVTKDYNCEIAFFCTVHITVIYREENRLVFAKA